MANEILLVLMGLGIGILSGMLGLGGGIVAIPAMMFFLGFTQAKANGTTLAMMLPTIGIFAVLSYWRSGNVDWKVAMFLALGFAVGALVGAIMVERQWINPTALRYSFAILLFYVAVRMMYRPGGRAMTAVETSIMVGGFGVSYFLMRFLGNHWMKSHSRWGKFYRHRHRYPYIDDYEI